MEKENILIACVGITDPIRSDYDGPILHITRYYHPKKIYMILSSEIAEREKNGNIMRKQFIYWCRNVKLLRLKPE